MSDYQDMFSDAGGATSDLFQGIGAGLSASAYKDAATADLNNAQYQKSVTSIQQSMAARKIGMTIGAEQAQVAGAGMSSGGSAGDLLRSSVAQGHLEQAGIGLEGFMKEQNFTQEAAAAKSEEGAATISEIGSAIGAVIEVAGIAAAA